MTDRYQLGWNDGYAEGYGCKLVDATEPFNPQHLTAPDIVEAVATMLQRRYASTFPDRPSAVGCARLMLLTAKEQSS
jgi:hypothetical protein